MMRSFLKIILGLLLLTGVRTPTVSAHEWYPTSCCGGNDCATTQATFKNGQWVATVDGRHPQVPNDFKPFEVIIPEGKVQASVAPDREAHICLGERLQVLCFWPKFVGY